MFLLNVFRVAFSLLGAPKKLNVLVTLMFNVLEARYSWWWIRPYVMFALSVVECGGADTSVYLKVKV